MTIPDMPFTGNAELSLIDEWSTDLMEVCTEEGKKPAKSGDDRSNESKNSNAILGITILLDSN